MIDISYSEMYIFKLDLISCKDSFWFNFIFIPLNLFDTKNQYFSKILVPLLEIITFLRLTVAVDYTR